jgi:hypothetical protein
VHRVRLRRRRAGARLALDRSCNASDIAVRFN